MHLCLVSALMMPNDYVEIRYWYLRNPSKGVGIRPIGDITFSLILRFGKKELIEPRGANVKR